MEEGERKNPGIAKEYRNEQIVVYWEPHHCIHTARCLGALPQVFDVRARPWIAIDAAGADEVARAVERCPTGALSYERLDGAPQEQTPEPLEVAPWPDGPLFVRGRTRVIDASGTVIRDATRVALCRCGASGNKPFCDGTHREIGFRAP